MKRIIANWKMNGSVELVDRLAAELRRRGAGLPVTLCPPFPLLTAAARHVDVWTLGAQDCHAEPAGAFTGRVSAQIVAALGARVVLVGHSECRASGDTDAVIRAKLARVRENGMTAILCVGESRDQHVAGEASAEVLRQLSAAAPAGDGTVIVAYEPVWAIGSGLVPDRGSVATVRRAIRSWMEATGASADGRVVYGGSVGAGNVRAILQEWEFDGALVGGASLDPAGFATLLEGAAAASR
jgi:triosephosphate isomerase (TIM)